jgi:phytoene desaturase
MNHAALAQGTFYPMGGMGKVIDGISDLALSLGVNIETNAPVERINVRNGEATSLRIKGATVDTDAVIAAADYHHVEQMLLEEQFKNYDASYWEGRTMAPSCMIFYLGVHKKLPKLQHHNLFFDTDFEQHSKDIYANPKWPADPLFYVCCPSKTDPSVAPEGQENLFVLIPIAPGLTDTSLIKSYYFQKIIRKIEAFCGVDFIDNIVVNQAYSTSNFIKDYHAFKGNAYGLANTLRQTAILKPGLRNKKISNLFYTGQLTVPGPGLPPALISGELSAKELLKQLKKKKYEGAF